MTDIMPWEVHPLQAPIPKVVRAFGKHLITFADPVDVGELQSKDISGIPQLVTRELLNVSFSSPLPPGEHDLAELTDCNLPWAEDHFQERVGGLPLNPGVQYKNWPWYRGNVEQHQTVGEEQFSHSYMERYWPKWGHAPSWADRPEITQSEDPMLGIRYPYGDLNDLVELLRRSPHTRQAYLPVWFPEDTGAVHGERVPCSLGYHFILRDGQLHVVYYIRSCDFVRHFRDDIYLTGRLAQWVLHQLQGNRGYVHVSEGGTLPPPNPWPWTKIGTLTMHITSLHCFEGDLPKLRREYGQA